MASYSQKSVLKPVKAFNIATINSNTTANGIAIDAQGFEALTFLFEVGARTDGTFNIDIKESDDNITFSSVSDDFLVGTKSLMTINSANTIKSIGYVGKKRYARLDVISTLIASTGATVSATAILGEPLIAPSN